MAKTTILEPIELFKFCPKCGSQAIEAHEDNAIKCKSCQFVYFFNASGAVFAFIMNAKNELLVTERAFEPYKGTLDLPGGFINPGETAENALIRELKEELNIDIYDLEICYTLANSYPFSNMYVHTIDLVFKAKIKSLEGIKAADDVSSYFFADPKTINPEKFGINSVRESVVRFLADLK